MKRRREEAEKGLLNEMSEAKKRRELHEDNLQFYEKKFLGNLFS
jgi:hypothetical protein